MVSKSLLSCREAANVTTHTLMVVLLWLLMMTQRVYTV